MALEMTLKRSKKPVYPTKTTINLAVDDKGENKLARNLVLFAVALVLIALFAKFAVVDVMAAASAASGRSLPPNPSCPLSRRRTPTTTSCRSGTPLPR